MRAMDDADCCICRHVNAVTSQRVAPSCEKDDSWYGTSLRCRLRPSYFHRYRLGCSSLFHYRYRHLRDFSWICAKPIRSRKIGLESVHVIIFFIFYFLQR
jgi:hypothetical protein